MSEDACNKGCCIHTRDCFAIKSSKHLQQVYAAGLIVIQLLMPYVSHFHERLPLFLLTLSWHYLKIFNRTF